MTHARRYTLLSYPPSSRVRAYSHYVIAPNQSTYWRGTGLVAQDIAKAICIVLNYHEGRFALDSELLTNAALDRAAYLQRMAAYYALPQMALRAAGLVLAAEGDRLGWQVAGVGG